ncbi:unnamed protein product [Cyprideis torosa]|uniref:Uncharacterized protein n=1 Tax=Cyprideis torosa TaxID=163714 RepID=A0A7R8ZVR7_9CRUS|nr:unnamed protein product [Cyprideis torosa]CAG0903885.1 unnamed protein product [Cyprideis torosa]
MSPFAIGDVTTDFVVVQLVKDVDMKSPTYLYEWPPDRKQPQRWMPPAQPFVQYMERYKDDHELGEDVLLERLKEIDPYEGEVLKLKYPEVQHDYKDRTTPTWALLEAKKRRLRMGKYGHFNRHGYPSRFSN